MVSLRRIIWIAIFGIAILNFSFASDRDLPWVEIISRSEWWADESIRLLKSKKTSTTTTTKQTEAQKKAENISKIRNTRMNNHYPNEWKYEWSNTMSWSYYLIYPEYFNHHKNKIIIHHTATNYDPNWKIDDVKKQIQQIYKYHTINRSFGDIWYNFLIDQLWNIYEWRAGGEWAVWMHAANNNITSVWISLLWNFENDVPTEAQLSALVNLTTAIARYYKIDPWWKTNTFEINSSKDPYVTVKENYNIMWHWDTKATACPGDNLNKFLPKIRDEVNFRLQNWIVWDTPLPSSWLKELKEMRKKQSSNKVKNSSSSLSFSERFLSLQNKNPNLFKQAWEVLKGRYKWNLTKASTSMNKISKKYSINDVKSLLKKDISVLLYELTTKYDSFSITCDWKCEFNIDWINYIWSWATLTFLSNKIQVKSDRNLSANNISVKSSISWGVVEVSNYTRKSYAWIPWNIFKGRLIFEKWTYPLSNWKQKSWFIIINTLPFTEYMRWIVETNDTETLEKNKVMAMIAKNYALFYLNWDNIHPSIPNTANYQAIDDPDFFQKYVWAWLEKTLTKRYQALNATNNEIVMYKGYLPILPYFSCSAWFTLSAKEKRWWNDTPYLQTKYDFDECNNFGWHWVWLAWKWAEWLAKNGLNYNDILEYYYEGVEITNIK